MDDYETCVVAMDKGTEFIRAVFFCAKPDAWKIERACKALGYCVKITNYKELKDMQQEEKRYTERYIFI